MKGTLAAKGMQQEESESTVLATKLLPMMAFLPHQQTPHTGLKYTGRTVDYG